MSFIIINVLNIVDQICKLLTCLSSVCHVLTKMHVKSKLLAEISTLKRESGLDAHESYYSSSKVPGEFLQESLVQFNQY